MKKILTSWEDPESLIYHSKQWENPKQSTKAFAKFISPKVKAGKTILDCGCGTGAALYYIAKIFRDTQFIGLDNSSHLISVANDRKNELNITNVKFLKQDFFRLKKRKQIDGVISLQTISWVKELDQPLIQIYKKISPNWICLSGLFYDGDISFTTLVNEHSKERKVYYNTYSLKELSRISAVYGYQIAKAKRFDIDIDIPEPKNKDQMATYTKRLANGSKKIQISGSLLLNWYFVMIEKI